MKICRKIYKFVVVFFSIAATVCGCSKNESAEFKDEGNTINFGVSIPEVATRVTVSQTANSNNTYDVTFDDGDKVGLYLYYNNFFSYYWQYGTYAESVVFANQPLTINSASGALSVTYSPLKSWTFSTLYGTKPYKYDAIAYYPYSSDASAEKWSDDASNIFIYHYDLTNVSKNCDFMISTTSYTGTDSDGANFRDEIINDHTVNLSFTRQMTGINICVSKSDSDEAKEVVIKGMTLFVDSYNRFQHNSHDNSVSWDNTIGDGTTTTAAVSYQLLVGESYLDTNHTTLTTTPYEGSDPDDIYGTGVVVSNPMLKEPLYFAPNTNLEKIVFDITVDGSASTFTWHPHTEDFVANRLYILNLELDPDRKN